MAYLLETGWNVALASLVAIVPQPRSDSVTQAVQRNQSASGLIHEIGLYIVLQWSMLDPASEYQALLDQFGLDGINLTNQVTVYVPDYEYVFRRYNGIAVRPQQGQTIRRSDYFIRDVSIVIKNLVITDQDAASAITLGAITLVATGGNVIGTAAITLGAITVVATGTVAVDGTASITLGATTVVGTGTVV